MSWLDEAVREYGLEHTSRKLKTTATLNSGHCIAIFCHEFLEKVDLARKLRPDLKRHNILYEKVALHKCSLEAMHTKWMYSQADNHKVLSVNFGMQTSPRIDMTIDAIRAKSLELSFWAGMIIIIISIKEVPISIGPPSVVDTLLPKKKSHYPVRTGKMSRFTGLYNGGGTPPQIFHFSDSVGESWKKMQQNKNSD